MSLQNQRKCHECGNEISSGTRAFQVEDTNEFGDKTIKVLLCRKCYEKRKKRSNKQYKILAFVIAILGLSTFLFAHEIANQVTGTQPLIVQIGGIFLVIVSIFSYFYGDPDYL